MTLIEQAIADPMPTSSMADWRARIWPGAALVAVAAPFLIAPSLLPSVSYLNQTMALFGWGLWLVLLAGALPQSSPARWPAGLRSLLAAFAILGASAIAGPWWTALPTSISLSGLGMVCAAALAAIAGTAIQQAGYGTLAFRAICMALLAAALASTAIAFIQTYAPQWADGYWVAQRSEDGRAIGNIRQSNQLGTLLLWGMAAVAWLVEARVLRRSLAITFAFVMMFALVLTGSRAGLVGVAMVALWGLLDARLARSTRAAMLLAPVAYGLFFYGASAWAQYSQQVFAVAGRLGAGADTQSVGLRLGLWSNTLDLIRAHPWFGVGFGEFNFAWSLTPFPQRTLGFADHSHNLPLQLMVELGLPLGLTVLALLGWALWSAGQNCSKSKVDDDGGSTLRTALFMVLLVMVHSLLDYPLWYAYFLLPATFAFGLCLGGTATADTAGSRPIQPTSPSFKLGPAALALLLGTAFSIYDYHRISALSSPTEKAAPLVERIAAARSSVFYGHHAEYAMTLVSKDDLEVLLAAQRASHLVLDYHLLQAWATALSAIGDIERARYVAQRLKEFSLAPQSERFFAPCHDPGVATENKPFQCSAPQRRFTFADFR
jgi:O-antigen ligase